MIDHDSVAEWLQEYIGAWKSYNPQSIGALFSDNATYRYNPYDEPVRGREAIVATWLDNRDEPNTYTAEYIPIAVDGNTVVANGQTFYYESDGTTLVRQFNNIFVLRFDDGGHCTDFCEWYMAPRAE